MVVDHRRQNKNYKRWWWSFKFLRENDGQNRETHPDILFVVELPQKLMASAEFLLFVFICAICTISGNNETNFECETFKLKCHNDTDCFHRIFYAHSTCITGKCKSQCKTAILRLYETDYGRKILHSDLSCVEAIKNEIVDCQLYPEAENVHCTLARQMCDLDPLCHSAMTGYEARCDNKMIMSHKCLPECVSLLADVFSSDAGQKMSNCFCWSDDALCHHMKSHVIDSCKFDAQLYLSDPKKSKTTNELENEPADVEGLRTESTTLTDSESIGCRNTLSVSIFTFVLFRIVKCHLDFLL